MWLRSKYLLREERAEGWPKETKEDEESVRSSRKSCRQGDCYEFGAGPISTSLNGIVAEDQAFPSPTFREFPSGIQNPSLN
uniref:Uncharacterized protein n=1 Tax=Vespula pensylvanica TaxID=30213 RepID=A0A834NYZ9_VESPE|nr:hypothetical protein H0235_009717 [Vespula pensylvanica]